MCVLKKSLFCLILLLTAPVSAKEILLVSDNYADQAVAKALNMEIYTVGWGAYDPSFECYVQGNGPSISKVYIIGGKKAVLSSYQDVMYWEEVVCLPCRSRDGKGKGGGVTLISFFLGNFFDFVPTAYASGCRPSCTCSCGCSIIRHSIPWERLGGRNREETSAKVFTELGKNKAILTYGRPEKNVGKALEIAREVDACILYKKFDPCSPDDLGEITDAVSKLAPKNVIILLGEVNATNYECTAFGLWRSLAKVFGGGR